MAWLLAKLLSPVGLAVALVLAFCGYIGYQRIEIADLQALAAKWQQAFNTEKTGRAEDNAALQKVAREKSDEYRAMERKANETVKALQDAIDKQYAARQRAIATARAERNSLLKRLAADASPRSGISASDPGGPRCIDARVPVYAGLLAEGVNVASDGIEVVTELQQQVTGLQRYVRDVCLAH